MDSWKCAGVVPVTKDFKVVMVRQYKHGVREISVEYPAGFCGDKNPEEVAKNELLEETGLTAENFELLAVMSGDPTKAEGREFMFLGTGVDLTKQISQNLDKNEKNGVEILVLSFDEVLSMIKSGEIFVSETIAATYLAMEKLGLLKFNLKT